MSIVSRVFEFLFFLEILLVLWIGFVVGRFFESVAPSEFDSIHQNCEKLCQTAYNSLCGGSDATLSDYAQFIAVKSTQYLSGASLGPAILLGSLAYCELQNAHHPNLLTPYILLRY